jgi:hypothetical protein
MVGEDPVRHLDDRAVAILGPHDLPPRIARITASDREPMRTDRSMSDGARISSSVGPATRVGRFEALDFMGGASPSLE